MTAYLKTNSIRIFDCSVFSQPLGLGCTWIVQQIECTMNIMFKQPKDLRPLYDEIIRTTTFTVKPDDIATFLSTSNKTI